MQSDFRHKPIARKVPMQIAEHAFIRFKSGHPGIRIQHLEVGDAHPHVRPTVVDDGTRAVATKKVRAVPEYIHVLPEKAGGVGDVKNKTSEPHVRQWTVALPPRAHRIKPQKLPALRRRQIPQTSPYFCKHHSLTWYGVSLLQRHLLISKLFFPHSN